MPLRQEFKISHCSFSSVELLALTLEFEGNFGIGEITFGPWTNETIESLIADVTKIATSFTPEFSLLELRQVLSKYRSVSRRSVLLFEMAYLDLMSKIKSTTINKIVDIPESNKHAIDEWVTIALNEDWPSDLNGSIKLKLGSDRDEYVLDKLHGRQNKIIIDMNSAWAIEKAKALSSKVNAIKNIYIEDPIRDSRHFHEIKSIFPTKKIIFDEPIKTISEMEEYLPFFDVVNIKLQKCGGLLAALEMLKLAQAHGKSIMIGCFIETPKAISYASVISHYAEVLDLDGADWLA